MKDSLSNEQWERIETEILAGKKIAAIKLVREYLGVDLRDAKQLVDDHELTLREQVPERFSAPEKGGCAAVLMIGVVFISTALAILL